MRGYDTDDDDAGSLRSAGARASCDSADSRVRLLSGYDVAPPPPPPLGPAAGDAACRAADLEHILARQARMPCLGAQRVVLTGAQRRGMQMATLATAVDRMGRLRYADQDCATARDRRASDIEGFFDRLDRLAVDKLSGQRFSLDAAAAAAAPPPPPPPGPQYQHHHQIQHRVSCP
ncbi:hypothetical protein H4R18_002570 [Coemansia javaensis]|uniref:Uncharacterized protein n=1 Tax=Coemansia javaensis TaxID=2761396 RepID=A0A9W8HHZ6_9FUNG|nr:hypothetical protein H4R18_002570 [Coemansia javaensis]